MQVIEEGVRLKLTKMPTPMSARARGDPQQLKDLLDKMVERGVVRRLTQEEISRTQFWTPVFGVPKRDSDELRLITDLRSINKLLHTPKFKQATWASLLTVLVEPKARFAVWADLKDFYHHLGLHKESSRWTMVAQQGYEFIGLPFGLSSSP